ncbi:MAG: GNAT family N-acetyltransferase [Candidatus Dormibacteraeota bacterium]|nr:GNAT family N-acetyltransferase [Candidatus Dormibacteraeota bacterium]
MADPALSLRPLAPGDAPELIRILRTPEVARWWGEPEPTFPLGDDAEAVRWTIEVDDMVAGMVQYSEETEPRYRHAAIDIFLDPAWHNQGVGTQVLRRTVQHLVNSRGHHRVTIDPAVMNTRAIRAYEKAGFRPVGVMRAYERDAVGTAWHDGLLMEFVADPD